MKHSHGHSRMFAVLMVVALLVSSMAAAALAEEGNGTPPKNSLYRAMRSPLKLR